MKRKKKSSAQLIINALLTGDHLMSKDISDMILEDDGRLIKVQDVASMLSKIKNTQRSDLGYFIKREKEGNTYTYFLVEEALELTEDQAYELTLKIGKDRYTLEQAIQDFPGLGKHVPSDRLPKGASKPKPEPKAVSKPKKPAKPAKAAKKPAAKKPARKAPVKKPAEKKEEAAVTPVTASIEGLDVEKLAADIIQKVIADLGSLRLKVSLDVDSED